MNIKLLHLLLCQSHCIVFCKSAFALSNVISLAQEVLCAPFKNNTVCLHYFWQTTYMYDCMKIYVSIDLLIVVFLVFFCSFTVLK